jgi:hypothetical protein
LITDPRSLHLDHIGSEVTQHHRAVRPGESFGQFDDPDAVKEGGHGE